MPRPEVHSSDEETRSLSARPTALSGSDSSPPRARQCTVEGRPFESPSATEAAELRLAEFLASHPEALFSRRVFPTGGVARGEGGGGGGAKRRKHRRSLSLGNGLSDDDARVSPLVADSKGQFQLITRFVFVRYLSLSLSLSGASTREFSVWKRRVWLVRIVRRLRSV